MKNNISLLVFFLLASLTTLTAFAMTANDEKPSFHQTHVEALTKALIDPALACGFNCELAEKAMIAMLCEYYGAIESNLISATQQALASKQKYLVSLKRALGDKAYLMDTVRELKSKAKLLIPADISQDLWSAMFDYKGYGSALSAAKRAASKEEIGDDPVVCYECAEGALFEFFLPFAPELFNKAFDLLRAKEELLGNISDVSFSLKPGGQLLLSPYYEVQKAQAKMRARAYAFFTGHHDDNCFLSDLPFEIRLAIFRAFAGCRYSASKIANLK